MLMSLTTTSGGSRSIDNLHTYCLPNVRLFLSSLFSTPIPPAERIFWGGLQAESTTYERKSHIRYYFVIYGESLPELITKIQEMTMVGWEPQGGVSVIAEYIQSTGVRKWTLDNTIPLLKGEWKP